MPTPAPATPETITPAEPATASPDIAVVITCFNYAHFVAQAIDSCLAQTHPYRQIVVVDDGSTDDSLDVIRGYGDQVQVVAKENSGLLGACMAGLAQVEAEYVHFLDADDTAHPDLVAHCLPALASRPVKLQFQMAGMDEHGTPNGSVFPTFAPGYDRHDMIEDNRTLGLYQCPPTSGNVFHVATLRSLHLDAENPRLPLDGAGCAVMPYLGEVVSLSEPLAGYRTHGTSMSNSQTVPTAAQSAKEIDEFTRNWEVATRLLGHDAPPYGDDEPLFLLERRVLQAALSRRVPDAAGITRYLRGLQRSHLPTWQRAVQGIWMSTMLLPSRRTRTYLVHQRRSGSARPQWMRTVIGLIRR